MHMKLAVNGQVCEVELERRGSQLTARLDGQTYQLEVISHADGKLHFDCDGRLFQATWVAEGGRFWLALEGCTYLVEKPSAAHRRQADSAGEAGLRSPMPALVRAVLAADGETVSKGQPLFLLEAMKMEIRLTAPAAGRLALKTAAGETVVKDQLLADLLADRPTEER